MLRQHLLADDRIGFAGERRGIGQPVGLECGGADGKHREDQRGDRPRRPRRLRDQPPDLRPDPARRVVGRAERWPDRPEHPAAADHQQGGQQRHTGKEPDPDSDRGDRAEPGRGVEVGEAEAQHADDHGGRARPDRGTGAVQRHGHRLVPVLVPPQLLAVAGDEQ